MKNECVFSPCRRYRYALIHRFEERPASLFDEAEGPGGLVGWVCLNPSTADENKLDPTLRRIKGYSQEWGFSGFVMLNLFAWRDTLPKDMKKAPEPVGPDNDRVIFEMCEAHRLPYLVCGWGADGDHMGRHVQFVREAERRGVELRALARTQDGHPGHPLYLRKTLRPLPFEY